MNFIERAFREKLTGDDFLQAMASIYSEPEVYGILDRYPAFVGDVIAIIDYDTAVQMDGLDDVINGNLSGRYSEIVNALERCGAEGEARVLREARALSGADESGYQERYREFCDRIALNNDYDGFWDAVRRYIDENLEKLRQ